MLKIDYELKQDISELEKRENVQIVLTRNLISIICEGKRTLHPITEHTPTIDLLEIIQQHKQMGANQSPTLFGWDKEGVEL